MSQKHTEQVRIYVACLAAYNSGILHGAWIDAAQGVDDIQRDISAMLADSPIANAEEWAIHDYEGFGSLRLSEYEGAGRVHEIACFIEEHGDLGASVLAHFDGDLNDAESAMENYQGRYTSLADYAAELTEQTITIPASLAHYIDYERMGRDLEMGGDVFTIAPHYDEVHIFLNI
jgi:antirestriction protein